MTKKVLDAVNYARRIFEIEGYPGDFFAHISKKEFDEKYNLIVFKEDIDKLSGFVGYGERDLAVVCINYKHPIGRQNFSLAHEIGHWIMHKGINISDDFKSEWNQKDEIEIEANDFARELLYPEEYVQKDYFSAIQRELFFPGNRKELAYFIDEICHKYFISFELGLRCMLYKNRQAKKLAGIKKEITKAIGGRISDVFDRDFYVPNEELFEYQRYMKPYENLANKVDILVDKKKIGKATGDSIKMRNAVEIE